MKYLKEIKKLYGISDTEKFGYNPDDILRFQSSLNIEFPSVLKQYYLELGTHQAINQSFNYLLNPEHEVGFSKDDVLVIYQENQAGIYWGIKSSDLSHVNPKVYGNYDALDLSQPWFEQSDNLENFLLCMALVNASLGGLPYNAHKTSEPILNPKSLLAIQENFRELKEVSRLSERYFTDAFKFIICISYTSSGTPSGVYIGTNSSYEFNSLLNLLPNNWDYRSDQD